MDIASLVKDVTDKTMKIKGHPICKLSERHRQSYLKALMLVCAADGVNDAEKEYMLRLIRTAGLSLSAYEKLEAFSNQVDERAVKEIYCAFQDDYIRRALLLDALIIAVADRQISAPERDVISSFATVFSASSSLLESLFFLVQALNTRKGGMLSRFFYERELDIADYDYILEAFGVEREMISVQEGVAFDMIDVGGEKSLIHKKSSLEWQQVCYDDLTHEEAIEKARSLYYSGTSGWRIPTEKELATLVSDLISDEIFHGIFNRHFFSDRSIMYYTGSGWEIDAELCWAEALKKRKASLRCVISR